MDPVQISLPAHARVWVYQAERPLNDAELSFVEKTLGDFIGQWEAHGAALNADYQLFKRRFIILAVDEAQNAATGCSIDKSVAVIRGLENALGIKLMDRSLAYETENSIQTVAPTAVKQAVEQGYIGPDTIIYNNMVSHLDQLQSEWRIPARKSWLKRFLQVTA